MIEGFIIEDNTIHNVTQLHPVKVAESVTPKTAQELQQIVREHKGAISIGGGRFSMGGQIASEETLHIDMRQLNHILELKQAEKTIRVEAWHNMA